MKREHETLLFIFLVASVVVAFIWGCAPVPREVVRTEYIKTPTHCQVIMPTKPTIITKPTLHNTLDYTTFLSNLKAMLVYTDSLEMALKCCAGQVDCISK